VSFLGASFLARTTEARSTRLVSGSLNVNYLLMFFFGAVFLLIALAFSIAFPNPTPAQGWVFVTMLALSAGGVGAMIPGSLHIEYKGIVRAGGAIALVAMVYFFKPALETTTARLVRPSVSPSPVALRWLQAVDAGSLAPVWNDFDATFTGQDTKSEAELNSLVARTRAPLGMVRRRQLIGTSEMTSPPGVPVGIYDTLLFNTKFANSAGCRQEDVELHATQDLTWKVVGFHITPTDVPCT
jgi:hypothetical protein